MSSKKLNIPNHVAIIMDGNGRWAKKRGLPRISGHHKGVTAVRKTVTACRKRGIKVLTLYSFSSQNWSRPKAEISTLMSLLSQYLKAEKDTIIKNDIRLTAIGNLNLLPESARNSLFELMEISKNNTGMILCLALSYGGQEEITQMVKNLALQVQKGKLDLESIDLGVVASSLWSSSLGPVDLIIRTSGELRISNFLLWSLAYAELFFTDILWPDFDEKVLKQALEDYSKRNRRFGDICS